MRQQIMKLLVCLIIFSPFKYVLSRRERNSERQKDGQERQRFKLGANAVPIRDKHPQTGLSHERDVQDERCGFPARAGIPLPEQQSPRLAASNQRRLLRRLQCGAQQHGSDTSHGSECSPPRRIGSPDDHRWQRGSWSIADGRQK